MLDVDSAATMIAETVKSTITPEKEAAGQKRVDDLLIGQRIVNMLVFDYHININFLRAVIKDKKITLQGVADSAAIVDRAMAIAASELPGYSVESAISVVQDFKAYPQ